MLVKSIHDVTTVLLLPEKKVADNGIDVVINTVVVKVISTSSDPDPDDPDDPDPDPDDPDDPDPDPDPDPEFELG